MTTMTATKDELVRLAENRMKTAIAENTWTDRQKLALTCRILFEGGHDSGLAGQITCRAEEPGTYFTQRLGLGFDEINAQNLLLVDEDLNVLEGGGMANPANRFHSWLYRARPDVNCIIHTHPLHIAALSTLEVPLVVSHMDLCPLYGDVAFLEKWPGVPVGNEEGEIIAVGPGARDDSGKIQPLDVKAGDRVLFGKWSGTEIKLEGEDLLIMKESDILGVVE